MHDQYLFHQGSLYRSYQQLGAHVREENGEIGVRFTVWAPHAAEVRVAGDFNEWDGAAHPLERLNNSGLWSGFLAGIKPGALYKYELLSRQGERLLRADPYAFQAELRPNTASVVSEEGPFPWTDRSWMQARRRKPIYGKPLNIYEVHPGSWKFHGPEEFYTYEELADHLIPYVQEMGYSHIELLPLGEHPFDGSWGYQTTGYFAVTRRYGTREQFKQFVNRCHEAGIGVIVDWVPGHFCKDAHGLRLFDGEPCYEYRDANRAEKPLWGTLSFDFGRPEVRSFLISNAFFWFDEYHVDGIRVDAVASMMSYNFDKPRSMWTFNADGGSENREAVEFLQKLNEAVFLHYPDVLMIAEDSSDRPGITAPTHAGGLGFNYKWNMGWMNDILRYMQKEPGERKHHHNLLTFSIMYAFNENFILPFSHDEVVHGKRSLLNKMPGDYWQKFAGYRALLAYLMTHPGKKLLFMGGEFAQFIEWKDRDELDWLLFDYDMHRQFHAYVKRLNHLYLGENALWEDDHRYNGFEWIDANNAEQSILSFVRKGKKRKEDVVVVLNFTPATYHRYRIGLPAKGEYIELLNSDDRAYGGSGQLNGEPIQTEPIPIHGKRYSAEITIPPLGAVLLKRRAPAAAQATTASDGTEGATAALAKPSTRRGLRLGEPAPTRKSINPPKALR
ncbi:1,4-alpha-glucan branching protein GlgB [Gorillibacterium sp. CAU 1737]|uniref:1,4-alpha-glucan branching protein GlgB n=1 Tax=Gorillibacterium sp. CAU 1737 TaxID=3140362 RepID=UPI003260B2D2